MPDNTWFTPYKQGFGKCLSYGPSQGIVYELDDDTVIKMPFQYPVGAGCDAEEQNDHLMISLSSFDYFKQECWVYDRLAEHYHPNIVTKFPCDKPDCIVIERVKLLEEACKSSTQELRETWILELLEAMSYLEEVGLCHGDVNKVNLGVGKDNKLKMFDFSSALHRDEERYESQVLKDQSRLATVIHYLVSGIDPFADVESYAETKRIRQQLLEGRYQIADTARRFQSIMETCWSQKQVLGFQELKKWSPTS